jgi:cysteine-rich repeat protein
MKKLSFHCAALAVLAFTLAAHAAVPGPVLNNTEGGWAVFGLQIQALTNTTLVSARFPNQGFGSTVALKSSADQTLFTTNIPPMVTNPVISINVPLVAGQTYRLVGLTANNNMWANFNSFPVSDGTISVISSWGDTSPGPGSQQTGFWASFNDITTGNSQVCGNGIVQGNEQCDDGNMSNNDACTNTCMNAVCGDGFVRTNFEQCDDGNMSNNDACKNNCQPNVCGDGIVNVGVEQCDDGNMLNTVRVQRSRAVRRRQHVEQRCLHDQLHTERVRRRDRQRRRGAV